MASAQGRKAEAGQTHLSDVADTLDAFKHLLDAELHTLHGELAASQARLRESVLRAALAVLAPKLPDTARGAAAASSSAPPGDATAITPELPNSLPDEDTDLLLQRLLDRPAIAEKAKTAARPRAVEVTAASTVLGRRSLRGDAHKTRISKLSTLLLEEEEVEEMMPESDADVDPSRSVRFAPFRSVRRSTICGGETGDLFKRIQSLNDNDKPGGQYPTLLNKHASDGAGRAFKPTRALLQLPVPRGRSADGQRSPRRSKLALTQELTQDRQQRRSMRPSGTMEADIAARLAKSRASLQQNAFVTVVPGSFPGVQKRRKSRSRRSFSSGPAAERVPSLEKLATDANESPRSSCSSTSRPSRSPSITDSHNSRTLASPTPRSPARSVVSGGVHSLMLCESARSSVGATYAVLDVWSDDTAASSVRPGFERRPTVVLDGSAYGDEDGTERCAALVVSPNSTARRLWDLFSMLLVAYDCVVIPLHFFSLSQTKGLLLMSWISGLFWTVDILASFCTGFVKPDGDTDLQCNRIAVRYLKSWFCLDMLMVVAAWLDVWIASAGATSGSDQIAGMSRTVRVARTLRMARLLRLLRMTRVISMLKMRLRSEKLVLVADLMKIVVMVLGCAHVLACTWYGLGCAEGYGDNTWLRKYAVDELDTGTQYALSFHWSLAQFSGLGFDEVHAQNIAERVYAIIVTFISFVVASVVVSLLTTTMTRLQILASSTSEQFATLRRYLTEKGISQDLSLRMQRNAQYRIQEMSAVTDESKVTLLQLISEPLLAELHFELHSPVLAEHPFLGRYCEMHPEVMCKVCHRAMAVKPLSAGDVLFTQGEIPQEPTMMFVLKGLLEYNKATEEEHEPPAVVKKSQWAAEGTLWTHWMHLGSMRALAESRLLTLKAEQFQDLVRQFWTPEVNPKAYAREFVDALNMMPPTDRSDLTVVARPDHRDHRDSCRSSVFSLGSIKLDAKQESQSQRIRRGINSFFSNTAPAG
eukprot:TRINITY_DN22001_c0_g1_i1.p1 TRINITY_DN22001_c0_g1~~TRINITY_DN22001_c0_g1_i1.p1  ORF type:complete len:986 (+),score=198.89 TRINITY_DN22001_c0_g1_i1:49-3006(+)